ncbi:ATP-binding protein [Anabaena sp. 4-3]|uniref:hybrid sensor histidine kinase/response regulator n=1 Tax=Anabaena sp. 4-3 TaxID=1811979 RepID=UPI000832FEA0|nr:ATP-binding protein [Anabaena sp. 4-3]
MKDQVAEVTKGLTEAFITYNREWQVSAVNAQAAQIFGRSCAELLGNNFWLVCPEFLGSIFAQECHRAIAQQSSAQFEQFCPEMNAWFDVYIYPTPTKLSVYWQNITERKQMEAVLYTENPQLTNPTLHQQQHNWQTLLDNSPDVIARFDVNLRYVYVNRAIEQALGLPPTKLIGKTHAELGIPEHIYLRWDTLLRLAFTTAQEQFIEFEFPTPRGIRIYQSRVVPEINPQGVVEYVLTFSRDVSEIKQLEQQRSQLMREQAAREEAERVNRIKDEFLAVLSHELRSPLNPILGWAKILQTRKYDTTTLNRALEIIERNAKIQAQLIEDLLDVSRILRGKLKLKECPVNLSSIVASAIETVRLAAEAKGVEIVVNCQPDVSKVLGDPERLQQVIWNLLTNAVKFTASGGRVEIRLEEIDFQAKITVSDNGIGIAPEFLPQVFDYFCQADSSITRSSTGLGLGLAIVHHLVELHGGTVTAHSPGLGEGSSFIVRLPILNYAAREDDPQQSLSPRISLEGVRILVVDDEADSREFVAFLLEQHGAIATTAASASQALEMFHKIQPDLIICDIGMPKIDGYTFLRQIHRLHPHEKILAIALTAYASETDQQKAYQAGFQKHIAKPIEPDKFLASVANLIQQFTADWG